MSNIHDEILFQCIFLPVDHVVDNDVRLIFIQAASNVDILETPTDLISFINGASSDYLLIVETHHW